MDWSVAMDSLRRGVGIASRAAAAKLRENVPQPPSILRPQPGQVVDLGDFGANPGRLRWLAYLPGKPVQPGAPLVVLLHGCGQQAAEFAVDSGWTALADRLALPLLLPEQMAANSRQRCFHWFHLAETRRGHGEAASIAAMVAAMTARYRCDPGRVFVAGLSAGGAMAAALLAAYPELFAAGAAFAGLPVGVATSMVQALARMANGAPQHSAAEWITLARHVAPRDYAGPWPRLSIWHGDADQIVAPQNSDALAAQWCALHGLSPAPTHQNGARRRWGNAVEQWTLPEFGHAWMIGNGLGHDAPYAVAGPVAAALEIARFWGIG